MHSLDTTRTIDIVDIVNIHSAVAIILVIVDDFLGLLRHLSPININHTEVAGCRLGLDVLKAFIKQLDHLTRSKMKHTQRATSDSFDLGSICCVVWETGTGKLHQLYKIDHESMLYNPNLVHCSVPSTEKSFICSSWLIFGTYFCHLLTTSKQSGRIPGHLVSGKTLCHRYSSLIIRIVRQ